MIDPAFDRVFDSGGVPRFPESGRGEPVALLHSFTGSVERERFADALLDFLARHARGS